jgi:hypothetical protein
VQFSAQILVLRWRVLRYYCNQRPDRDEVSRDRRGPATLDGPRRFVRELAVRKRRERTANTGVDEHKWRIQEEILFFQSRVANHLTTFDGAGTGVRLACIGARSALASNLAVRWRGSTAEADTLREIQRPSTMTRAVPDGQPRHTVPCFRPTGLSRNTTVHLLCNGSTQRSQYRSAPHHCLGAGD